MSDPHKIILSVSVDEGDSEKRLAQLVLAIEKNQQAQKELTKAREAGTISADEFAKESVKLTNQLITQRAEQSSLTKEVTKATPETKKLGSALLDTAKSSSLLGGAVAKVTEWQERFTQAQVLAKAALGANVTALGVLRLALLATGLGALVVVLGSVVTFLTKTQAGSDLLSRKMAGLGAAVRVITNLVADFGGKLVAAADNPKQAFSDLVDFIGTNLMNRLKAFAVIVDAIRSRDLTKLNDGFIQLGTGITDGTAKAKALITQLGSAQKAGQAIEAETQRIREAERALNVTRDESRAKIEALKKLSDDSTKAVGVRTAAAKQAAAIENGLLTEQLRLQDAKIANLRANQALQKNLTTEDKDELAALRSERAKTAQESYTIQTELQNKLNSLNAESADKRIAARKAELDAEAQAIARQLKTAQVGSEEELKLLQAKLRNSYQAELNVKGLTVGAKRAIDEQYESNRVAQDLDFARKRMQAALQAAVEEGNARLAQQQTTGADLLRLQAEQIENQRQLAIAGLQANADNTAKIQAINAQAANQQRQLEYQEALRLLEEYLSNQRKLVEQAHDEGKLGETAYFHQLADINKAGTDAQTVINQDYRQDNTANQQQADADEAAARRQHTAEVKQAEQTKQEIREATVAAFQQGTEAVITAFGEESAAGQAALAFRKVLALAEIGINLQKQLSLNAVAAGNLAALPIIGPGLALAYKIAQDALAIAAAAAGAAKILSFEQGGLALVGGGVAQGPSHAQGGIQLLHNGRPAGIEIEGGEAIINRNSTALFLPVLSALNQLGGGRALTAPMSSLALPHLALGGVTQPLVLQQLRGGVAEPYNYQELGRVLANELRRNPPVNVWSHFERAQRQAAETLRRSSF